MKTTKSRSKENGSKKPKLPRKRKKMAIKAQGRKWYFDTVKLYGITGSSGLFLEPTCKFWVNSEVNARHIQYGNGNLGVIPTPTKYW
jgi:hypothetical protein